MNRMTNFFNCIDLYERIYAIKLPTSILERLYHNCEEKERENKKGSVVDLYDNSEVVVSGVSGKKHEININKLSPIQETFRYDPNHGIGEDKHNTNWQILTSINEPLKPKNFQEQLQQRKKTNSPNAINNLKDYSNNRLQLTKILEALTCSSANDFINFECFETLGDVFLKFVYCEYLLHNYENADEGDLNNLKSEFTSNLVLWKLGTSSFDIEEFIVKSDLDYCLWRSEEVVDEEILNSDLANRLVLARGGRDELPKIRMVPKRVEGIGECYGFWGVENLEF